MKKQNGEFVGKLAPYGYIKDPKDKHKFLIDKNVSHIIRKIFDIYHKIINTLLQILNLYLG